MPELPEVQTTVTGLSRTVVGQTITDVWTDYNSPYFKGSDTIKDPDFFKYFKKEILGKKIISVSRRAKNVLINLEPKKKDGISPIILIHMKMTGHLLYGTYQENLSRKISKKNPAAKSQKWLPIEPESLKDPFNRHIHLMISFSNGKKLALCDMRKFAKITLIDDVITNGHNHQLSASAHLNNLGPEPLEKEFTFDKFLERINIRPNGKIKLVLLDQEIIAGIGNIYADESLWFASIHPLEKVENLTKKQTAYLYNAVKKTLSEAIITGGASTSDYRNVNGEKGTSQENHHAYRRAGEKCDKKGCLGKITRITVGSRGTHFCPVHQILNN